MTKYREIIRLHGMGFSNKLIAESVPCSRNTAAKVIEAAEQQGLQWPLPDDLTDGEIGKRIFQKSEKPEPGRRMPDYECQTRAADY